MKERGITLIALVITIIILLILAGISIATLTGENGILTKAGNSKERTIIAEEMELIKLAYINSLTENITDGTEIIINNLEEEINKSKTASVEEVSEIPEEAILIDNGISSGTICKITMNYVYYMYLKNTEDSSMQNFYIELYNGEELVKTVTCYFTDDINELWEWVNSTNHDDVFEEVSNNEVYAGENTYHGYTFTLRWD